MATGTSNPLLLSTRHLIDALPYIDEEISGQSAVDRLIQQEMKTFVADEAKYLAYLPSPEVRFNGSERLAKEYKRVKNSIKLNTIDMNRYNIIEPSSTTSAEEYQQYLNRGIIALEYERLKQENLSLQQEYHGEWNKYYNTKYLKKVQEQLEQTLEAQNERNQEMNVARRHLQELNGNKLQSLKRKAAELQETTYHLSRQLVD